MLQRRSLTHLIESLDTNPVTALLGPRQVGKTTLARALLEPLIGDRALDYLDLESPADLAKLDDPIGYLAPLLDDRRLIVIDEIQRVPGLFQVLRSLVDERILAGDGNGQFLLLGSASIDLLKQSSETLAGRIGYLELCPLDVLETQGVAASDVWLRGGFPRSLLANSDERSTTWRADFISTYLERDIPLLGPRIPATTLRRFWTMLAHRQGAPLNAADIAAPLSTARRSMVGMRSRPS